MAPASAPESCTALATMVESTVSRSRVELTALHALSQELKDHGITTHTELAPELPLVPGHSGQLQEVILNLVQNAIDAMDSVSSQTRVLRVSTESLGSEAIAVSDVYKRQRRESACSLPRRR